MGMQVLAFKPKDMQLILETFQIRTNKKGELMAKNIIKCAHCGKRLKKENVGSILASSPYKFYCDNPACITEYVRKTKFGD